jgi:hypothetical protein
MVARLVVALLITEVNPAQGVPSTAENLDDQSNPSSDKHQMAKTDTIREAGCNVVLLKIALCIGSAKDRHPNT